MLVLKNAHIPEKHQLHTLVIEGERISAIGEGSGLSDQVKAGTEVIDLHGYTVMPGFVDAHLHLQTLALSLRALPCETPTRQACLERVTEASRNTGAEEWITGHGWDQNLWEDGYGNKQDLDKAAEGKPVFLTAKSLHAAWASSAALKALGIHRDTPNPEGGFYGRDADGNLNGLLFESAVSEAFNRIPLPPMKILMQAIQKAIEMLWAYGVTEVHDFDPWSCYEALQNMDAERALKLRVLKSIPLINLDTAIEMGLRSGTGNPMLRVGHLKLFADGALGPQTAAMLEPYEGSKSRGMLTMEPDVLMEHGRKALRHGISLATHAIGDRANQVVLNVYTQLVQDPDLPLAPLPLRIEHAQLLPPDAESQFHKQGITASMQPLHATEDMEIAEKYWGKRSKRSYAWQTLTRAGVTLAFGSDAPVVSPNPIAGIYASVTRRRQDGSQDVEGWIPAQRVDLKTAIKGYTEGPAHAGNVGEKRGKLEEGYEADLIILPKSLYNIDIESILDVQPCATMVAGQWVWHSNNWNIE